MAYYSDMSQYEYIEECLQPNTFNVGWLSRDHPFEQGKSPLQFQQRLLEFCVSPLCKTRGWHVCEFCEPRDEPIQVKVSDGKVLHLGSAEIRVIGNNKIFASPNLIYHYITAHQYLPPKEFVDAVLNSPLPTSEGYKNLFMDLI